MKPIPDFLMRAVELLNERFRPKAVFLFGSQVGRSQPSDADVDIAILFEEIPDGFTLLDIQEDLSAVCKHEVDLVVLNTASPILAMQVIRKGEILVNNNPPATARFVMMTINKYHDLKTVRRPIEANIQKGGIFYGR